MKIYEGNSIVIFPFDRRSYESMKRNKATNYDRWFLDQKVTQFNDHGLTPMTEDDMNNFFNAIDNGEIICSAIGEKKGEDEKTGNTIIHHVGNCTLQSINQVNRSCEFAIIIGEVSSWGKGCATKALAVMLHFAFNVLNMNRVWSGTTILNKGMLRVFVKLGFTQESVFRDGKFVNGKYIEIWQYSMLKKEFDKNEKIQEILKEFVI